jgi:hypothetical protein
MCTLKTSSILSIDVLLRFRVAIACTHNTHTHCHTSGALHQQYVNLVLTRSQRLCDIQQESAGCFSIGYYSSIYVNDITLVGRREHAMTLAMSAAHTLTVQLYDNSSRIPLACVNVCDQHTLKCAYNWTRCHLTFTYLQPLR